MPEIEEWWGLAMKQAEKLKLSEPTDTQQTE